LEIHNPAAASQALNFGTAWTQFDLSFVVTSPRSDYRTIFGVGMYSYSGGGATTQVDFDDVEMWVDGAQFALPCDEGGGPQARDAFGREFCADITSGGIYPAITAPIGARRQIYKSYAHSDISSTAATTSPGWLPAGWVVREFHGNVTAAFDAAVTLDSGISGTPAKFMSALAVSTTGFKRAASLSEQRESKTAHTTLYIKKSGATTQGAIECVWIIERVS
jgi:hypothetical protein